MDLLTFVRARGGIVRSSELRAHGATNRALSEAVATGGLVRPRRGWMAAADADPVLLGAARSGVVLTCITRAARLGLWVLAPDGVHVAAPAHSGSVRARGAVVHWHRPLVPRPPTMLEDGIENTLVAVALCQPFESALAVWESALRASLVDVRALERLRLPLAARRILEIASPWSDSGLETLVLPRLRWLKVPLRRQIWLAGHRVDLLIGDRLVLQIDGGHHVGAQRSRDIAHDAELTLLGYHVIRIGYHDVVERWPDVQDRIMRAVAQGLHLAP
ncbi:type IV toxin-antitoxin system AbiEi family antitoxin domain-containing protein [Planococcus sp. APC 4015]|nr:type IV toxin-antitoxin system AbiEi family antitoxin domain-containing protein [Planococcus sp. APC 4015]